MTIAGLVAGGLLLAFGRKLFWLLLASVGFFAGYHLASQYFPNHATAAVIIGLALGLIAAFLAVFIQRLAVWVGGFLAGGYLVMTLLGLLSQNPPQFSWLPFLIGGVLGAVLLSLIFDWALVFLSSLVGAVMIVRYSPLQSPLSMIMVVGLFILGVVIQTGVLKKR